MENGKQPINATYFKDGELNALGLTKREYFAGLAMESLVKATCVREETFKSKIRRLLGLSWNVNHNLNYKSISNESIKLADELLKQLEDANN